MRRLSTAIAALLLVSRAAAAQTTRAPGSEDDIAWPREHTVKLRRPRALPPPQRTSATGDRIALLGHLGIGAPAGAIGVDVDIAPVSFLALDLGAGLSPGGWQIAATPRFRIRLNPTSFLTLGGGVSLGPYENSHSVAGLACVFFCIMDGMGDSAGSIATQHYQRALWYNLEFGGDIYSGERGMLRVMAGYAQIANNTAYSCWEDPKEYYSPDHDCGRTVGQGLLFAAFAGGFDL
ncbi:MAG: hypothetical protein ABIQ16_25660 [Polyangiaceae bacterium]